MFSIVNINVFLEKSSPNKNDTNETITENKNATHAPLTSLHKYLTLSVQISTIPTHPTKLFSILLSIKLLILCILSPPHFIIS